MTSFRIAHPAPLEITPARARTPRFVMARAETVAAIPTLGRTDLKRIEGGLGFGLANPVHRGDGGLWSPVRAGREGLLDEDRMRAWLAGEMQPGKVRDAIDREFAATPLVALERAEIDRYALPHRRGRPRTEWPAPTRGEAVDLDGVRGVSRDGREAAGARARAFAADDLRIVGGVLWRRVMPVAAMGFTADRNGGPSTFHWTVTNGPAAIRPGAAVATPRSFGRIRAKREAERHGDPVQPPRAWLDLWDDVPADADARAFANACTLYMRTWLDDMVSAARAQGLAAGPDFEEAVAAAPALREAEILGMTGSLGADDLPEAIRVLLRGADALWNGPREMGMDWQRPDGVVTMEVQLRHDYLPALLGEISDDDIAALTALGAP